MEWLFLNLKAVMISHWIQKIGFFEYKNLFKTASDVWFFTYFFTII